MFLCFKDFYNFMEDSGSYSVTSSTIEKRLLKEIPMRRYSKYLTSFKDSNVVNGDLDTLLNGVTKKKLKIIPNNIT